jgi:SOS response regulatory protein OraA/RecX
MSILKPSGNTGEEIERISVKEKSVTVYLEGGSSFKMAMESYVSGPHLYPGKRLSASEIRKLSQTDEEVRLYAYLTNVLATGRLFSRNKLLDKLIKGRKASYQEAQELLLRAEKDGLIDDDRFLASYISQAADKGRTEERIVSDLIHEGYKEEKIRLAYKKLGLADDSGKTAEENCLRARGRNLASYKDNAASKLIRLGYQADQAYSLVEAFLKTHKSFAAELREKELSNLHSEYLRITASLSKSLPDADEVQEEAKRRLLSRRYGFDDIIKEQERSKE